MFFVLGMIAANIVRPHVLTADSLRLRSGIWADVHVPLELIATVTTGHRDAPTTTLAVVDDALAIGVFGSTNLELQLTGPMQVTVKGRAPTVRVIRFAAYNPRIAARAVKDAVDRLATQPRVARQDEDQT